MNKHALQTIGTALLMGCGLSLAALPAKADTLITFDDLPVAAGSIAVVPNGYAGLDWSEIYVEKPTALEQSPGYLDGVVSPSNAAFNLIGGPGSFSSTTPFTLESMYVTASGVTAPITFEGYVGKTLAYTEVVTASATAPTLVKFNWTNVDEVTVSANYVLNGLTYYQTAVMDNILVSTVPEPGTDVLLLLGLVGCFAKTRRRVQGFVSQAG